MLIKNFYVMDIIISELNDKREDIFMFWVGG